MIGPRLLAPNEPGIYRLKDQSGNDLFIATTLDRELQDWAIKTMSRVEAYLTALVVLEPTTGNVLAMTSCNNGEMGENYTLQSSFPAASLFKIVTAAAVLEAKEMPRASSLTYSGQPHTLYRKYLVPDFQNGQHRTTLEESFAKSINIVFGKLGAFTLGAGPLEDFAERFYFNRRINFDMPVEPSRFDSPGDDAFLLAEKASGFNIKTCISPLHAAMIAGAVANEGVLMEPSLIKEAFDQNNTIYFRSRPTAVGTVMDRHLVPELKEMMKTAISRGTARPSFRDQRYHRTLSRLKLGGKTGTINDVHERKVDWFVAFAEWPETDEEIALAVLVVHNRDVLGLRARAIGREAILRYFNPRIKTAKRFKTAQGRVR
jgi:cell division protein FtsI/penicillin-binding protein 2